MTLITITETGSCQETPNATLCFDHGTPQPITITPPCSDTDVAHLRWYFEDYPRQPFTGRERAQQVAQRLVTYGERLFAQVFAPPSDAYTRYQTAAHRGLHTLQVDIIGSPAFHQLPWEALREPGREPLALHAAVVRRSPTSGQESMPIPPSPTLNLLVMTARPYSRHDVGGGTIAPPLLAALRQVAAPVQVDIVRPGTYKALVEHLRRTRQVHGMGYYHIVHVDVPGAVLTDTQLARAGTLYTPTSQVLLHNRYDRPDLVFPSADIATRLGAYLFFNADTPGDVDPATADELAQLLRAHHISIAIVHACQTGQPLGETATALGSHLLQAGIQTVLTMGYAPTVSAVRRMMRTFYQNLLQHQSLLLAWDAARRALYRSKQRRVFFNQSIALEDWLLPAAYQSQGAVPVTLPLHDQDSAVPADLPAPQRNQYQAPEPLYGFVGREVDRAHIEQRLLSNREGKQRNLLLVRGMGGAGKTTLLHHLGQWWQTTGLIDTVFYFSYDEKAHTRDQIVDQIAWRCFHQTVSPGMAVSPDYAQFQTLQPSLRQERLVQRLRTQRHLLILDNLESITGASLATPHILSEAERGRVRSLLSDLLDGQTLVLLGSQGSETWLSEGANAPLRAADVYDLPGLDDEAASRLAERILTQQQATHYLTDAALPRLLTLLDGFPLALEAVLATLAHQSPAEVLEALQAGALALDQNPQPSRTASVVRCIGYAYSNLAPEAQQLLLCLAPFSGVLNTTWLPHYLDLVRQTLEVYAMPLTFAPWEAVLQELQTWGLVAQHERGGGYLRLHPSVSSVLKMRLQTAVPQELAAVIHRAFCKLYQEAGRSLDGLISAKEAQKRQLGQTVISLEYDNLLTAMRIALADQEAFYDIFALLHAYLGFRRDSARQLALGTEVVQRQTYSPEKLQGDLGVQVYWVMERLGTTYVGIRQYDKARGIYRQAMTIIAGLHDIPAETQATYQATILHRLGRLAQTQRLWGEAEQYYQQTLALKIAYNQRYRQASTYYNLGVVVQGQQQWQQAEQYYQQALAICIAYNDRYRQARTYHRLGMVMQGRQQWQQADQYYQQALALFIEYNDRYRQARTYHNLGVVAQAQQQWQQAEQYYQQALTLKVEYKDHYRQASTYHNLGLVAQAQQQWGQAKQYYQQALALFIEHNDRYSQAGTYHNLGLVAQAQQQWGQARDFLLKDLAITITLDDQEGLTAPLQSLAQLWQASHDADLPTAIASILQLTPAEVETWLSLLLADQT